MELKPLPESVLERYAAVYIRQSSPIQVLNNQGSAEWQRNLKQLAERKGWEATRVVLFADLGVPATPGSERPEFQSLLNFIGTGQVGMLFVVDGSRLARNETDWAILMDLCSLTKTWICVDNRISDLDNHSHRFRLGLNATITQAANQLLRTRLNNGKRRKAAKGQLYNPTPIGYEYSDGVIIMTDDLSIRDAINHVFDLFDEIGTAIGVAKHYNQHQMTLPSQRNGSKAEIVWLVPHDHVILEIIRNPKYAGSYAWGRSQIQVDKVNTESGRIRLISRRVVHRNPLNWHTLLHDAYPGYITWEQYERNQERLRNNKFGIGLGTAREGKALLQGLIRCGICDSAMTVAYQADGSPSYRCDWGKRKKGARLCQCLIGPIVERVVVQAVLTALTPAQIEVALEVERQLPEQLRRQHEASLRQHTQLVVTTQQAKARYLAAADRGLDNRLLSELECDWNTARNAEMAAHNVLVSEGVRKKLPVQVQAEQVENLSLQFSELWNRAEITNEVRKELIRSVIRQVTLRKDKEGRRVYIVLSWHSDSITSLVLTDEQYRFDPSVPSSVINLIRELSEKKTDIEIARYLNAQGIQTGSGQKFSKTGVNVLQIRHNISRKRRDTGFTDHRPVDTYSGIELQKLLNIDAKAIAAWERSKILSAERNAFGFVGRFHVTKEQMEELRQQIEERRKISPTQADIDSFEFQRMTDSTWNLISSCLTDRHLTNYRAILDGLIWTFRNKRNWNRVPPALLDRKACMRKLKSWRTDGRLQNVLERLYQITEDNVFLDLIEFLKHSEVGPRSFCGEFPSRTFGIVPKNASCVRGVSEQSAEPKTG